MGYGADRQLRMGEEDGRGAGLERGPRGPRETIAQRCEAMKGEVGQDRDEGRRWPRHFAWEHHDKRPGALAERFA